MGVKLRNSVQGAIDFNAKSGSCFVDSLGIGGGLFGTRLGSASAPTIAVLSLTLALLLVLVVVLARGNIVSLRINAGKLRLVHVGDCSPEKLC